MGKWSDEYDFQATRSINPIPAQVDQVEEDADDSDSDVDDIDPEQLARSFTFAVRSSVAIVNTPLPVCSLSLTEHHSQLVILLVLIPLPLFFAQTVYSVQGLTVWVVIGIIWTFFSAFAVVVYPIIESRGAIFQICKGIVRVGFVIAFNDGLIYLSTIEHLVHEWKKEIR